MQIGVFLNPSLRAVRIGRAAFVALMKDGNRPRGNVEPRHRHVGGVPDVQSNAAKPRQIGSRSEPEVEVVPRDSRTIQTPAVLRLIYPLNSMIVALSRPQDSG